MSQAALPPRITFAEYLRREVGAEEKHQLVDGEVFNMAGGTPEHALIAANVAASLHAKLAGGPCRVYSSDLRVGLSDAALVTYPDVTVVCGELSRHPDDKNTVMNPKVIIEVLSQSTEAFDRGRKFSNYKHLPSLQAYVLVSQDQQCIEVFQRAEAGRWTVDEVREGAARIDCLDTALTLAETYAGVPEASGG